MNHSVAFYMNKGFDKRTAEYFASGRKRIIAVSANQDLTLTLDFDNGERRLYDCKPIFQPGTVFEPFIQLDAFRRVYLDCDNSVCWDIDPSVDSKTLWSNKVDLSPDRCYIDSEPLCRGTVNA